MSEKQPPKETSTPFRKGIDPTPYAADLNQSQSQESQSQSQKSTPAPQEPTPEPPQSDVPEDPGSGDQTEGS